MARKKSQPGSPEDASPGEFSSDLPGDLPLETPPGEISPYGIRVELPPETPAASPAEPALTPTLEHRIDRLESALGPLQQLEGLEERLLQRVTAIIDRAQLPPPSPPSPVADSSILHHATALGEAGKHLFKSFVLPGAASATPAPTAPVPHAPARPWAIREILAEAQAMFYMFVDPRYRLSWVGRVLPFALLGLFLTTGWWVPYALCGFGELFRKPIELLLCFSLIKLLSYEGRRYRETAPDLPPSMRL